MQNGRGRGAAGSGRLGAIPKQTGVSYFRGASTTHPVRHQFQTGPFRGGRGFAGQSNDRGPGQAPPSKRHLDFFQLVKLTDEKIESSDIIRCLGHAEQGVALMPSEQWNNLEIVELILVAMGNFCVKSGASQFTDGFIAIVRILAEKKIFAQIASVVINIPQSRNPKLPDKAQRLRRLLIAIHYLATEMLVMMPAFACNFLGRNFFEDIVPLNVMPTIKSLNVADAFSELEKGIPFLQMAWEQNTREVEDQVDEQQLRVDAFREVAYLQKPADDFRSLNVMPNWEDICTDVQPFLRPNIVKGSYPDVGTYLDVQFRLLREDFFQPLRAGLTYYLKMQDRKQFRGRVDNIRLYYDVKILDHNLKQDTYTIQFSMDRLRGINWESSKRLLHGSLLCLSSDGFKSFHLFTVADRKADGLQNGVIQVRLEGAKMPPRFRQDFFVMVESAVFFEAYRSVLTALQRISPTNFPMEDYILGRKSVAEKPDYLATEAVYDLKNVLLPLANPGRESTDEPTVPNDLEDLDTLENTEDDNPLSKVPIMDSANLRPTAEQLGLDSSQTAAFYAALTQKLSVIQGPPGTGKTYLGLRIVQVLLKNKPHWRTTRGEPILVICYTNHALDQFLEGIANFTPRIVRIGGQSKCPALEPFSLMNWKKNSNVSHTTRRWLFDIYQQMNEEYSELEKKRNMLAAIATQGILHEDSLLSLNMITTSTYQKLCRFRNYFAYPLRNMPAILLWLQLWFSAELSKVARTFFKNSKVTRIEKKETTGVFQATPTDRGEELALDDQWDKEDIDAIQAERLIDDDDNDEESFRKSLQQFGRQNRQNFSPNKLDIKFAFDFGAEEGHVINLRKSLNTGVKGEDAEWIQWKIEDVQIRAGMVKQLLETAPPADERQLHIWSQAADINTIPLQQRWMMYMAWKHEAEKRLEKEINLLEKKYLQSVKELKDVRSLESAEICREADIVGITTTGAAKQRALLDHLKSKIVVVEEAAEVLEAHIVTALSVACQQLILIGDHQQLRPPTTVFKLAKDYSLDVSLFERLIKNGMKPSILGVQHRMRPEVARLIVPAIYPHLENHVSVLQYPSVRGMSENVFFLDHTEKEIGDHEGKSHLNPYEADLSLALARHLILQGYSPSQITILTTYSGQLLHFRKLRRNHALLQPVRISVVDNFQGEENDIIILSLVRSNDDENIGFLRIENRICVALSRAKIGFYLIGNMQNLQGRSKLWDKISHILRSNGQLDTHFGLKCDVHGTITKARLTTDFPPEGGCLQKCATSMPCGHNCPKICHADNRDHKDFKCQENCTRMCSSGHPCPKKCHEDCHPCMTVVTKTLPCTHEQATICEKDPAKVFCKTMLWKTLPECEHRMELQCGASTKEANCLEKCNMSLDCGHPCPLSCHKRTSHAKVRCREKCTKTCAENHPCTKMCCEACGNCKQRITRTLPCSHEREMECYRSPQDVFCKVEIEKVLSDCQHTAVMACGRSTDGFKCKGPCEKLVCSYGHKCKKRCFEACGQCFVRMERELACGHKLTMVCHVDSSKIICPVPKECVLPLCGHKAVIRCGEDPLEARCPEPCDIRLDCGHKCTRKCHLRDDPDHETYECKKPCEKMKRGCKTGEHKCGKKCFEECKACQVKWNRDLPCGHSAFVECHLSDEDIFCQELVKKSIPECGHEVKLACSYPPTRADCKANCELQLACGHACRKACREPCNRDDCRELFNTETVNSCGHTISVICKDLKTSGGILTEQQKQAHLKNCSVPCGAILGCEHRCKGTCGACFNGRVHLSCREDCGRSLICGHLCNVNCATSCPPCQRICEFKCQHSKCSHKCSTPCSACQERCEWSCEHYKCTEKCGQCCNRPKCDEPCRKLLPCGHACVGLCGELCPPLCRTCDKEKLTEFTLLGNEEDEDAKFVYLPECGHCIEVEGMDHWMSLKDDGEIKLKCCPRCKTFIRSCLRYGDIIKITFRDIADVKSKIFSMRGSLNEFFLSAEKQLVTITGLLKKLETIQHPVIKTLWQNVESIRLLTAPKKTKKGKSMLPELDAQKKFFVRANLDFLDRALTLMKNIPTVSATPNPKKLVNARGTHLLRESADNLNQKPMKPELVGQLCDSILKLLHSLINRDRISNEEYQAVSSELERLDLIRAYFVLQSADSFPAIVTTTSEKLLIETNLMKNIRILDGDNKKQVTDALKSLGEKLRTGIGISDKERRDIVQAMGMTQGHWYKCPNGHIYAIGDCGGASQVSQCNECGAAIGGSNHRLLGDNRLAGEMDGAARSAWPGALH